MTMTTNAVDIVIIVNDKHIVEKHSDVLKMLVTRCAYQIFTIQMWYIGKFVPHAIQNTFTIRRS